MTLWSSIGCKSWGRYSYLYLFLFYMRNVWAKLFNRIAKWKKCLIKLFLTVPYLLLENSVYPNPLGISQGSRSTWECNWIEWLPWFQTMFHNNSKCSCKCAIFLIYQTFEWNICLKPTQMFLFFEIIHFSQSIQGYTRGMK